MIKLQMLRPKELEKLLLHLGFQKVRQKGSHAFYKHQDGRYTTIPFHVKDLPRPLVRDILRQIEINIDEFNDILNKI